MDLINAYPNLPGIRTSTQFDFVKKVAASTGNTQAVLIIGTARDGSDEPVRLTSAAGGLQQYGEMSDANNESERRTHLVRGMLEVNDAGCNDVWCLRIGGTKASLNPTYTGSLLDLTALYAGEKYGNQYGTAGIGVLITENSVILKNIENTTLTEYHFTDGESTFSDLIDAINGTSLNIKVRANMRGNANVNTVITSSKPAIIDGLLAETYNIVSTDTLDFVSIDGDTNAGSGWSITFPGTRGTVANHVACANKYFIMSGVNDVLTIRSSTMSAGVYETLSVLPANTHTAHYTGAQLATRIQTVMNASALITSSSTNAVTATYTASSTPFTIAIAGSGVTLTMDYSLSTIANTIGFTSAPTAAASIVSDTRVDYNVLVNGNDRFVLNENNQFMLDCSVSPGNYLAAGFVTAINASITAAGGTTVCSHNAGIFTFTSSRYGSQSSVLIADGSTTLLPLIGFDGVYDATQGTGFAAFLDAATALEVANRITSYNVKLSARRYIDDLGQVTFKIYSRSNGVNGSIVTESDANSTLNVKFGITASHTYSGQAGNLPVTLPPVMAPTWSFVYMSGGDDGMNPTNDELLDLLAEAYKNIEDLDGFDYIVPMGTYVYTDAFGNVNIKHALNLARVCTIRSALGHYTHGCIAVEPAVNANLTTINARVATLGAWNFSMIFTNDYYKTTNIPVASPQNINGKTVMLNMRNAISIIAGPDLIMWQSDVGYYKATGEAAYPGLASSLPVTSAPTNKIIRGPVGLYYKYGTAALDTLVGARFVTFKQDTSGNIKPVLDVTYDYKGETYDNLYTFKLMSTVIKSIIAIAEPYIGQAANDTNLTSLGSAVQKYLDDMKAGAVLRNFTFSMQNPGNGTRMADLFIDLVLDTYEELKTIYIRTKLSNNFKSDSTIPGTV